MRVRTALAWTLALALPVAGLLVAVAGGWLPLGLAGEWTWGRVPARFHSDPSGALLGGLAVLGYIGLAALGARVLAAPPPRWARLGWLSALVAGGAAAQLGILAAAPAGFGLEKWGFATYWEGPNGYYTVAHDRMPDGPWQFWARYPAWVVDQDALHIGTHPPGLMLGWRAMLDTLRARPALAGAVVRLAPAPTRGALAQIERGTTPLSTAEKATLTAMSLLTLAACVLTVVPLYALARARLSPSGAWAAACLWPLAPSAILFGPGADTAFPLLATTALALASRRRPGPAALAGAVLALGMFLTLAFLAVGLIVALILAAARPEPIRRRLGLIAWTGAGFVAPTALGWLASGANPLVIWWWNQHHHARFYAEFPRSYLAWQLLNPLELAIGLGLPTAILALAGLRAAGPATWATLAVMALLQLTGRNLSEVARIWLPLLPPLCVAAGAGLERIGGRAGLLAAALAALAAQTGGLQALVQVVYGVDFAAGP